LGGLEFASLNTLGNVGIQAALDKFSKITRLNMADAPVVEFVSARSATDLMAEMTKFLKFALTFV
jgi:hypothetical protein